jgi:hypothetical protein
MLYSLARAALFKLDPETAHDLALRSLAALGPGARVLGSAPGTQTPSEQLSPVVQLFAVQETSSQMMSLHEPSSVVENDTDGFSH